MVDTTTSLIARAKSAWAEEKQRRDWEAQWRVTEDVREQARRLTRMLKTRLGIDVLIEPSRFTRPDLVEVFREGLRFRVIETPAVSGGTKRDLGVQATCPNCHAVSWLPVRDLAHLGQLLEASSERCRDCGAVVEVGRG